MYYSFFEIFSIGVGPSSSHTVGPMRAAKRYIDNLHKKELFDKVERVEATLYGSLALTGFGHGTVKAIVYGFMGLEAEAIDPEKPYVSAVERDKILHLGQERPIPFDIEKDVIFEKQTFLPEHSNGMRFRAYDRDGNVLLNEVYFRSAAVPLPDRTKSAAASSASLIRFPLTTARPPNFSKSAKRRGFRLPTWF